MYNRNNKNMKEMFKKFTAQENQLKYHARGMESSVFVLMVLRYGIQFKMISNSRAVMSLKDVLKNRS